MTFQISLMLITLLVAAVLFSIERIPVDVVALGVLLFIIVTGLLPAERAFIGFGSEAVMMILGLLILTAALTRTGVVDILGRMLIRKVGKDHNRLFLWILIAGGLVGAFISKTAAVAFFVPVIFGIARKARMSPSKLLLPVAFASILSSSVTLVATTTNIVVNELMVQKGLEPLGMFELTPAGLPIMVVGLLYMFVVGKRLIPEREKWNWEEDDLEVLHYLTEVVIQPSSSLVGMNLGESGLGEELDLTVVGITRNRQRELAPGADFNFEAGDILLVKGDRHEILRLKDVKGLELKADKDFTEYSIQSSDIRLVEVILLSGSPLIGRTLKGMQFREQYGLQVLAMNRHGETQNSKLSEIRFQLGDVLMIQGDRSKIAILEADRTFRVLGSMERKFPKFRRAPIAIGAFVGSLILGSLEIFPFSVAAFLGVVVVFLTRCITPEEAYRSVEWRVIILIGCMLGMGYAMESTGTAQYLAHQIVNIVGKSNPTFLLAGFFLLSMVLTQPMSNQAAAALIVPIAMQTALEIGSNPRAFAIMIAVGSSCSYLTPLEPACMMVFGPGRYKFSDFLRVGSILTVLIFLLAMILVPLFWPI